MNCSGCGKGITDPRYSELRAMKGRRTVRTIGEWHEAEMCQRDMRATRKTLENGGTEVSHSTILPGALSEFFSI